MTDETYVAEMADAYLASALWTDAPDGQYDLTPEALKHALETCEAFHHSNKDDLDEWDAGQAGHDLWLTRNCHGTGFWDRGKGEAGNRLSVSAEKLGLAHVIPTDNNTLHIYEG